MKISLFSGATAAFLAACLTCSAVVAQCSGCRTAGGENAGKLAVGKPKITTLASAQLVENKSVHDFKVKNLAGEEVDLSKYKGKVALIFNAASKCGHTKQYSGLQALHEKYKDKGLAVLGFPANEFGGQEPGTDAEIGEFCKKNFGVTFDMFSKVVVKGEGKTPLFQYLTETANPDLKKEIGWNFEKFLISKDGKLVARFASGVMPDSAEITSAIEAQLNK